MLKREECCKFEDEIRKLGRKRYNRKKIKIANVDDADDECEDFDDEKSRKYNKNGRIDAGKSGRGKLISEIDEIVGRIKPGISTRDEYSLDRHARCIALSNSSRLKVTKKKEIKNKIYKKIIKTDKIKTKKEQKDQKKDEDETNSISETSDEFHVNSEYDDEICSFDSQVDFSGLTLTLEDENRIVENIKSK